MKPDWRRTAVICVAILIMIVVGYSISLQTAAIRGGVRIPFSRAFWLTNSEMRYPMIDDVTNLLANLRNEAEVINLLGPADQKFRPGNGSVYQGVYHLGSCSTHPFSRDGFRDLPSYSIDNWYLFIDYKTGAVIRVSIHRT